MRHLFLLSVVAHCLAVCALANTRVRIVTAGLSSGSGQSYDSGEGIRILRGLSPDLALIQEFNYKGNTALDIRSFAEVAFGRGFEVCRDNARSHTVPNGIVSRFRILECHGAQDTNISNREYTFARIQLPGGRDLWAFSVHLKAGTSAEDAAKRAEEAGELVKLVRDHTRPGALVVIGGDLNTKTRDEAAIRILTEGRLFVDEHKPVGDEGKEGTNIGRNVPLDWVLPSAALDARHVAVQIGHRAFREGLVFDSRTFTPLALVAPVLLGDSTGPGMQHMAVVKDYSLPE